MASPSPSFPATSPPFASLHVAPPNELEALITPDETSIINSPLLSGTPFIVNTRYSTLICLECKKSIDPDKARAHATKNHKECRLPADFNIRHILGSRTKRSIPSASQRRSLDWPFGSTNFMYVTGVSRDTVQRRPLIITFALKMSPRSQGFLFTMYRPSSLVPGAPFSRSPYPRKIARLGNSLTTKRSRNNKKRSSYRSLRWSRRRTIANSTGSYGKRAGLTISRSCLCRLFPLLTS